MESKEMIAMQEPDPSSSWCDQVTADTSQTIEQELRQTVQHLAIQNMHLYASQQNTEKRLSTVLKQVTNASLPQVELLLAEREQHCQMIETLQTQIRSARHSCETQEFSVEQQVTETDLEHGEEMSQIDLENTEQESDEEHAERNKREMEKFKEDLGNKREARHRAISAFSAELERLRGELNEEKLARKKAEAELELQHATVSESLVQELKRVREELHHASEKHEESLLVNKRLEGENEQLQNNLKEETLKSEADREYSQRRIGALKEVAALSKQMLSIRESQVTDLKGKIKQLEALPSGSNLSNAQLQAEYDTQISNIKALKTLYEDRLKSVTAEKEKYLRECGDKSEELEIIVKKCSELEIRLAELEKSAEEREDLNTSLQTRLDLSLEESKSLSTEISLINSTFTQMLVGNSTADLDLDKLTKRLQENHDLITEMTTKEDGSETAASLPKLLLDLINQVHNDEKVVASTSGTQDGGEQVEISEVDCNPSGQDLVVAEKPVTPEEGSNCLAVEEIASNLPKVWRILMELLSHHIVPTPAEDNKPSCYKCIDTPSGPQFVPSVSNTYIRLKDLILEKKSLQKDLGKLKQLNGHLESKLQEQENRLLLVTAELRKTWSVVGRLRSQFKQLHTHEQILRYELQQKRHLLTELKNELEYCREKWERARQKDRETEVEWKKLRKEFAARKKQDQNNSAESGFSDERENESGDEENIATSKPTPVLTLITSESNLSTDQSQEGCSNDVTVKENNTQKEEETTHEINQVKTVDEIQQSLKEADGLNEDVVTANATPKDVNTVSETPLSCTSWSSWITLLKLFRCENNGMTLETSLFDEAQALESIFSLPKIIVPEAVVAHSSDNVNSPLPNEQNKPKPNRDTIAHFDAGPSTSSTSNSTVRDALGRTPEEALAARSARLKRLEEQTQMLFNKVTRTTNRSMALSNRLEELHGQYGIPNPPPLPPTLPVLRIPVQDPQNTFPTSETILNDAQETMNESTGTPDVNNEDNL